MQQQQRDTALRSARRDRCRCDRLMDALKLNRAVLAGYHWDGRAACVAAALWPERCTGLVSVNSYLIQDIAKAGLPIPPSIDARGAEAAADWRNPMSPETYVGYERAQNFASRGGAVLDKRHVYAAPARLRLNYWALSGDWTVKKELTMLNQPNGRIAHRFHARDLHLVMGPAARGASVRFRVLIDGQAPRGDHGLMLTNKETARLQNSGCIS
jgi:pimeloyl-ACP methyl ester carboxylesterase